MSSTKKQQRKGAKQRSIQTGFNPSKSILGKGLGYLFQQRFLNWNKIESIARDSGIYTPEDLIELINTHSPIKRIGVENMYIFKIIYEAQQKDPNKSFYAIGKDNLERIMILQGQDPRLVDWGTAWQLAQKAKGKKIDLKKLKSYTQLLKNLQKKYSKIINKPYDKKIFLTWLKNNKENTYLHFADKVLKNIKNPKHKNRDLKSILLGSNKS
jgi:hypothetical protein